LAKSNPIDLSGVASRLREAIGRIGTQAQAAAVAKVSERQVRKYLSGKAMPNREVLWRLALAAKLRPDWLRTGTGVSRLSEHDQQTLTSALASASPIEAAVDSAKQVARFAQLVLFLHRELARVAEALGSSNPVETYDQLAGDLADQIAELTDPGNWMPIAELLIRGHEQASRLERLPVPRKPRAE
jgi:transcriptional regulator with XRE-family HTH domain